MRYINNNLYIALTIILGVFTYLLNFFNKIAECSLVFVFLALTVNIIAETFGKQKAMRAIVLCIVVSFGLLWNLNYYIDGRVINGLVLASLLSVLLSTYCGMSLFLKLKSAHNFYNSFYVRNFISLTVCAIVDGVVMAGFFINQFSASRVLLIFFKEVSFKCIYSLIACIFIFVGSYLVQKVHSNNKLIS